MPRAKMTLKEKLFLGHLRFITEQHPGWLSISMFYLWVMGICVWEIDFSCQMPAGTWKTAHSMTLGGKTTTSLSKANHASRVISLIGPL